MNTTPIEFMCYNKKTKKMWDAYSLRNIGGFALTSGHSSIDFLVLPYPQDDYELMQLTVLRSISGEKIYNHMIVKDQWDDYYLVDMFNYDLMHYLSYGSNMEIVGNRFQNPELLERCE